MNTLLALYVFGACAFGCWLLKLIVNDPTQRVQNAWRANGYYLGFAIAMLYVVLWPAVLIRALVRMNRKDES